jgi:uncharacterized protein
LKINISHIPEDGLKLQFDKNGEWFHSLLSASEKNVLSLQRVDVVCSVRKLKETVFVEGRLETTIATNCCRCLEPCNFTLESNFKYTLMPVQKQLKEEQELNSDELELVFYEDDVLDLDTLIFEQIMLQIPMKVLCKDTCKGLCPHCGKDLNMASCNCPSGIVDERLAVLQKFKKEN